LNRAFHAPDAAGATVFCPRLAARFGLAPGALTIGAAVLVLLVVSQARVGVQLFAATCGALLGMWAVRRRSAPAATRDEPVLPQKRTFRSDTQRLSAVGDAMLQKCRKENRPLSIAVFDFSDLPELQAVFEGRIAVSLGALIARKLQEIAPVKGVVVRTGPTTFAVLLPNFDRGRARLAIGNALGKGCCVEFDVGNSEVLLVPDHATRTVRAESASVEQVHGELCAELVKGQQHAERRQAYLTLERESHTRPQRLAPAAPMAATIPVPMGLC
jgi:GGDEF domain-containing protein